MGDEFQQTNNGNSTGSQGHKNTINVEHNHASSPVADVFQSIADHLDANNLGWGSFVSSPELQEIANAYTTPKDFVAHVQAKAEEEIASEEPIPAAEYERQKSSWTGKFKAVVPLLVNSGLKASLTAIETYEPKSPIAAGLLTAFKFTKSLIH